MKIMKHSILLLVIVAIIFSGCEKEEIITNGLNPDDMESKTMKFKKEKRTFEGICTFVAPVPNTWYDASDDWRVTGTTIWTQPDPSVFGGTAELFVEAKKPHDTNRGKWEMTWNGTLTPTTDGFVIVAVAKGVGVEGKVKGLKANWTYTMNYVGADFPNPENPTFFYAVKGNIDKPQGPIRK
jgi:hypothetical protein